jgi:hypothetical protein
MTLGNVGISFQVTIITSRINLVGYYALILAKRPRSELNYTASQPRRPRLESSLLWKQIPQMKPIFTNYPTRKERLSLELPACSKLKVKCKGKVVPVL